MKHLKNNIGLYLVGLLLLAIGFDNPNDDYDQDGLTEVEGDCDDNDKDITKIIWYVDGDGDGFGLGIENICVSRCM